MANAEQKNANHMDPEAERPTATSNGDSSDHGASKRKAITTSDDIVKDLLDEVRHSDKPFTVEDLAAIKKEKKKSKEHKHKKSKKKKKHHSKRDHSGSRKRSRSRSRSSRKKHKKRSRSRSKSRSRSRSCTGSPVSSAKSQPPEEKPVVESKPEVLTVPPISPPLPERSLIHDISDDDDLPVGADFRTVMKEAKMKINISNKIGSSLDLSAIPSAPPLAKRPSKAFPLSKNVKKDADDEERSIMEKRESDVLNKVIAEKGRGDFVPRNLKVKSVSGENCSGQNQAKSEAERSFEDASQRKQKKKESTTEAPAAEEQKAHEFGPSAPPSTSRHIQKRLTPVPEPISDGELVEEQEKEIVEELAAAVQPRPGSKNSRMAKIVECSSVQISSKNGSRDNEHRKRRRPSPGRRRSASPDTDVEIRRKARSSSRGKVPKRAQSPYRARRRDPRERRSRSSSRKQYSRSRSRSRSRDRCRRRTRSRSRSRSTDRYRTRSWRSRSRSFSRGRSCSRSISRDRSRSRNRNRSRSRSPNSRASRDKTRSRSPSRRPTGGKRNRRRGRDRIDKEKLLSIARRKAQKMQLLGISLGPLDATNQPKSVDDFVSYCQQIQRRQDKESRREKGEAVSSDDDGVDGTASATDSSATFKHPFGVRSTAPADSIKINIVNANSIAAKTPQEKVLDSSQLRLVYPVSSGITHKENTDVWTPVVKTELKTCSDEQKKYVAVTSLAAEQLRSGKKSSDDHLLPPPPAPPVLTGLGGLLPPPPPPPKLTAFDMLLPPPPPLPPLLVVPPEDDLIMKEPDGIETAKAKDVAKVLAQRASAQLRLSKNPNDYEAIQKLKEADDQMASWAAAKNLPGKFTGSTGVNVLSSDELQPNDPRYNAWVKKDEDVQA